MKTKLLLLLAILLAISGLEQAHTQNRLAVKRKLRGKVELSQLEKILAEIMEQAEGQYKDYPMVG